MLNSKRFAGATITALVKRAKRRNAAPLDPYDLVAAICAVGLLAMPFFLTWADVK